MWRITLKIKFFFNNLLQFYLHSSYHHFLLSSLRKMLHSSINLGTHVAAPLSQSHPASVPFLQPSSNFPVTFRRHIRLSRTSLSHSRVRTCNAVASDVKTGRLGYYFFSLFFKYVIFFLRYLFCANDFEILELCCSLLWF